MAKRDTTLYVITYDIPDDKRRTRVHRMLQGFGAWTQYSVFEVFVTDRELVQLRNRMQKLVDPETDSIRLYRVCARCLESVETIGSAPPEEPVVFVV